MVGAEDAHRQVELEAVVNVRAVVVTPEARRVVFARIGADRRRRGRTVKRRSMVQDTRRLT